MVDEEKGTMKEREYAGFWIRTGAAIIDSLLILVIIFPIMMSLYGANHLSLESTAGSSSYWASYYSLNLNGTWDFILNYILPAILIISFWIYKSATPGKIATKLTIVDAKTGRKPTTGQFIIRYLGYFVSMFPFFLGIIWIIFDKRKQGWHDKLARTVVIRELKVEPVKFENDEK
jgi:uncharacterized RDD family membrane protein YckC